MIKECMICHKQLIDGQWKEKEKVPCNMIVSHGYCPECFDKVMKELDKDDLRSLTIHSS
jgi:hypothetical protein